MQRRIKDDIQIRQLTSDNRQAHGFAKLPWTDTFEFWVSPGEVVFEEKDPEEYPLARRECAQLARILRRLFRDIYGAKGKEARDAGEK